MPHTTTAVSKTTSRKSRTPTGLRSSKYSVTAENLAETIGVRLDRDTKTMLDELRRACCKSRNAAIIEGVHLVHAANIEAIRKERKESQ